MSRELFTKPKTPRHFGFAPTKPKTQASLWRGSTKDVAEAAEKFARIRQSAICAVRT